MIIALIVYLILFISTSILLFMRERYDYKQRTSIGLVGFTIGDLLRVTFYAIACPVTLWVLLFDGGICDIIIEFVNYILNIEIIGPKDNNR